MELKFDVDEQGVAYTYVNGVKGTLRQMDFQILKQFTESIPTGGRYVETGSYLGCSSVIAALSVKRNVKIFAHDLWEQDMNNLDENGSPPPFVENYFYKFYNNIKQNNLENVVIPIRGDSSWTLGIHDDESIDVAFIDGDHSYEGIQKDLKAAWPKMKENGYILCHDCSPNTKTLAGLVDFVDGRTTIHGFQGTDMKMIQKVNA